MREKSEKIHVWSSINENIFTNFFRIFIIIFPILKNIFQLENAVKNRQKMEKIRKKLKSIEICSRIDFSIFPNFSRIFHNYFLIKKN